MEYYRESIKKQPNEKAWVTFIKAKVTEENQSFPALTVGQTGKGKSWSILRLCTELDPNFQLDGNWYFRAYDFHTDFTEYYKNNKNQKRGKIWVLDEAGVDWSSDEWQSVMNKVFAQVFSTQRFRNYIFFGTVVKQGFISKKIRELMQYSFIADGVITKGRATKSVIIPRLLQWNPNREEPYRHKLIANMPDGEEKHIGRMLFSKPKKSIRDEYERRRKIFGDSINTELLEKLKKSVDREEEGNTEIPLPPNFQNILECIKQGKTIDTTAIELNMNPSNISKAFNTLKRKGYAFKLARKENYIYYPETKKWETYPKNKKFK